MSSSAENTDPRELTREQLIGTLEKGCKPESDWRIGTEHEKFGFRLSDHRPLAYAGVPGIQRILSGMAEHGWQPVFEGENVIALSHQDSASISLEPGGQLELSGAPLATIHETCNEVNAHLKLVKQVAQPLGAGFIGLGFHPTASLDDISWMPKARYQLMRKYMPRVGTLGLDMMKRTCTVQVNLDFSSEADMVEKFRVSLALQPLATALFANSPFTDGQPNGYLSYRSQVWTDTDPARAGMLPFVFESGMGFERWVDYMLDVPMYFVRRGGQFIDTSGLSFRDFLDGRLAPLPGQKPRMGDWQDHLTTVFPEVRLKTFLEMRGADGGPWRRLCALPAFWVGLLYDSGAQSAAWDVVKSWSADDREKLRNDVPRLGLEARICGRRLGDIAVEIMDICARGLRARRRLNGAGDDETGFLTPLHETVESGLTPAQRKLSLYHGRWGRSLDPLFAEFAY